MVDEKRWGWSGLKGFDEIYNFRLESEGKRRSLGAQIFDLRFLDLGIRDFEKETKNCGVVDFI